MINICYEPNFKFIQVNYDQKIQNIFFKLYDKKFKISANKKLDEIIMF